MVQLDLRGECEANVNLQKYNNLAEGDKERYQEEYSSIYGHLPGQSVESPNAVSVSA